MENNTKTYMAQLPQTKLFPKKIVHMIFLCLLVPFNVENFKKSLEWIRSFEDTIQFWVQNGTLTPTWCFFRKKTINLSFMYPFIMLN